jgi:hypothetical protein
MKIKVILDNPNYFDRYSVYFTNGTFLSLSTNCNSPQGYSQWGEWSEIPNSDNSDAVEETEISFEDLPLNVQSHIFRRMKE